MDLPSRSCLPDCREAAASLGPICVPWRLVTSCRSLLFTAVCFLTSAFSIAAQQPFVTDNAAVTDPGIMSIEVANELDKLQPESLPDAYQNVTSYSVSFGVFKRIDISVSGAYLSLISDGRRRLNTGYGDTSLSLKYNFRKEHDGSRLPAMSVSVSGHFPTGSATRGLGSGVYGFSVNGIAEKSIRKANTARINLGYLLTGTTVVGDLGIGTVRGGIFTGGASFVREFGPRWLLGGEVSGAVSRKFRLSAGQLQTRFGGNYRLTDNSTLDFGISLGRFSASPRAGFIIGYTRDIKLRK